MTETRVRLLCIGVGRYFDGRIAPLRYATRDAEAVWNLFSSGLGDQVRGSLILNPDHLKIQEELRAILLDSDNSDVVLVYYAGHGTPSHQLTAADSSLDSLEKTTLAMSDVATLFDQCAARIVILVLDACFSGGATPPISRAALRIVTGAALPRHTLDPYAGFQGAGKVLLAAARASAPAYEHPKQRHGLLTHALLTTLSDTVAPFDLLSTFGHVVEAVKQSAAVLGVDQEAVLLGAGGAVTLPPLCSPRKLDRPRWIWWLAAVIGVGICLVGLQWFLPGGGKHARSPTKLSRVTTSAGLQTDAAWSPDARFIAYVDTTGASSDIFVQSASGGEPIRVTHTPDAAESNPDWTPDGQFLVFRSEVGGGGIYKARSFGGPVNAVRLAAFGHVPRVSPDGSKVLFLSSNLRLTERPDVYVVGIDGSGLEKVSIGGASELRALWSAVWLPDSHSIMLAGRAGPSGWALYTAGLQGGVLREIPIAPPLRRDIIDVGAVRLSPAGDVLFLEDTSARMVTSIWQVEIDPSTQKWLGRPTLLSSGMQDNCVAVAPDGKSIAFSRIGERNRIWVLPLHDTEGNGRGEPVTDPDTDALFVDVARDGDTMAYLLFRSGVEQQELMMMKLSERKASSLRYDDFRRVALRWSPDAHWLAYGRTLYRDARSRAQRALVMLRIASMEEAVLLTSEGPVYNIPYDWSSDGQQLLVGSNRDGSTKLYEYDVARATSGESLRLVTGSPAHEIWQGRMSPDDRWIAFAAVPRDRAGESVIYVMRRAGGNWVPVSEQGAWADKPRWSTDGRALYFMSNRGAGVQNVWKVGFDPVSGTVVGEPSAVTRFRNQLFGISPLVASVEMGVSRDRLVLPIREVAGGIWTLSMDGEGASR